MSLFKVEIARIANTWPHPNADRLALAGLTSHGYQFVIGKDAYAPGDHVVYFPLDSILPPSLIATLGLEGKLASSLTDGVKLHNRVRTVRLRGSISQGLVAGLAELGLDPVQWPVGSDVTEFFGVTKHEPPAALEKDGNLVSLPALVGIYDLENAEHFLAVQESLMDETVLISEKLEGSHWGISLDARGTLTLLQRRHAIRTPDQHTWWRAALLSDLPAKLQRLMTLLHDRGRSDVTLLTLRGEIIGPRIQGNVYRLRQHEIHLFEIEINGRPVDAIDFLELTQAVQLSIVPILSENGRTLRQWLDGQSLPDASNGVSRLADVAREGIVIRPLRERQNPDIGRTILKQRSPSYLASEK